MPAIGTGRPVARRRRGRLSVALLGLLASLALLSACGPAAPGGSDGPRSTPLLPATPPVATRTPVPTPRPTHVPLPAYQAGVNLLLYSDPGYRSALPALITRLRRDHVNSVAVTFPFYQSGLTSSSVHAGSGTPPDAQLSGVVDDLEAAGFSVMLRPLLDESDLAPLWRGAIAPTSVGAWFASYTTLITHYAKLAAEDGVQVLDVGTELLSLEADTSDWLTLIARVRSVYPGKVTYAVNGISDTSNGFPTGFIGALDFLSVDGYWNLAVPDGTGAAGLARAWLPYLQQSIAAAGGKPVVLSEVGVVPQQGAQDHPWKTLQPGPTDDTFQATYYEGACQAASTAHLAGLYWWEVNLGTPGQFDPIGMPAERAIASCFATAPSPGAAGG